MEYKIAKSGTPTLEETHAFHFLALGKALFFIMLLPVQKLRQLRLDPCPPNASFCAVFLNSLHLPVNYWCWQSKLGTNLLKGFSMFYGFNSHLPLLCMGDVFSATQEHELQTQMVF